MKLLLTLVTLLVWVHVNTAAMASAAQIEDCDETHTSGTVAGKPYVSSRSDCPGGSKDEQNALVPTSASKPVDTCNEHTRSIRKAADGHQIELKVCSGHGSATKPAKVNWGMVVLRAFRAVVIPKAQIVIQPPGGKTLINFDTLYRTKASAFTRSFKLLGSRIQLRIRPTSYTWVTGDGDQFTTTDPGVAYDPDLPMTAYVSHDYEHPAEALHPRVDVTWAATYRVGNGRWLPVEGTVTTTGTEADLKVVEARSVLLSGYGN